jgi:hypothetical protein
MARRRRRTKKRAVRTKARRATRRARVRSKKGVRGLAQSAKITPAQRKRLNAAMRDFERHIDTLTRKYNQVLTRIANL